MTTGERLVSISTLETGTAMEHFLNIQTGGGSVGTIVDVILKPNPIAKIQIDNIIGVQTDKPLEITINKLPNVEIDDEEIEA